MRDISIVDEFAAPLCDAITERTDSASVLRGLGRANRFVVSLDQRGQWYRFHRLFRQLLLRELRTSQPAREPALHHRASEWYLQEGQVDQSIAHAVRSHELDRAAELILANWIRFIVHWRVGPVAGWLDLLPDSVIQGDRRLAYVAAAVALIDGNGSRFSEYLGVLKSGPDSNDNPPPAGDLERASPGSTASKRCATPPPRRWSGCPATQPFWLWNAQAAYGRALYLNGDPAAALPVLEQAIDELTLTRFPVLYVYAMGWAALVPDECGLHDQAWRLASAPGAVETNDLRQVAHWESSKSSADGSLRVTVIWQAAGLILSARCSTRSSPMNHSTRWWLGWSSSPCWPRWGPRGQPYCLTEAADALARVPDATALHERLEALRHRLRLRVSQRDHLPEPLSDRELGILRLLGGSLSQPEIASELGISAHTVKSHARAIYRKLGVSTREEALSEARDLHLLGSAIT